MSHCETCQGGRWDIDVFGTGTAQWTECAGCGHDKMARQYLAARELHPPPGEGWIEFALSVLSRSAEACGHETELAALRGALVVADEMSELLCTLSDPEYLQRIRLLAKGAVARYQAAREKVGK